jgi:ABC-2 type transport system ATP-binding protein
VIVAEVDGHAEACQAAVRSVPGVRGVEVHRGELLVTAADGAAAIGPVAVALSGVAPVRNLTLRTTTLDDVFLELTGNHIRSADPDAGDRDVLEVAS